MDKRYPSGNASFRKLPSVNTLLESLQAEAAEFGHEAVKHTIQHIMHQYREAMKSDKTDPPSVAEILATVKSRLGDMPSRPLLRVYNLTGTVLHTNLGRALLPDSAVDAMIEAASGFTNLEYDLELGGRGQRDSHVESDLCALTGAEACTVVNNNAAAVLLALNTLAYEQQVPVSRGELVEIGGSFRIPDIMTRAGCQLVEVGTTNRTHLQDYDRAVGEQTALFMKVHCSNFAIHGFTSAVGYKALANLASQRELPLVVDLGSGSLATLPALAEAPEPLVSQVLEDGANLVTFSGDKLLGGPQCGVIAGDKHLIDRINSNPMKRALRVDKLTLAALAAVLASYRAGLESNLPTQRFLSRSPQEIRLTAERLQPAVDVAIGERFVCDIVDCASQVGSGALPTLSLDSVGLSIRAVDPRDDASNRLASAFRKLPRPVIGSQRERSLRLDLRCMDDIAAFEHQLQMLKL